MRTPTNIGYWITRSIWGFYSLNLNWSSEKNNETIWVKGSDDIEWYLSHEIGKWLANLSN